MDADQVPGSEPVSSLSSGGPRFSYAGAPVVSRPPPLSGTGPRQTGPLGIPPAQPGPGSVPPPFAGQSPFAQQPIRGFTPKTQQVPGPYNALQAPGPPGPPTGLPGPPTGLPGPPTGLPGPPGLQAAGASLGGFPPATGYAGPPASGPVPGSQFSRPPPFGAPPGLGSGQSGPFPSAPPLAGAAPPPMFRPSPAPSAAQFPQPPATPPVPMGPPPRLPGTGVVSSGPPPPPSLPGGIRAVGPPPTQAPPPYTQGQDFGAPPPPPTLGTRYPSAPPTSFQYGGPPTYRAAPPPQASSFGRPQAPPIGPPPGPYGAAGGAAAYGGSALDGSPLVGGYPTTQNPSLQPVQEDFQSLSVVPVPGAVDSAIDPAILPRPSDQSDSTDRAYVANCHPRFMRLTTNAMPNSNSLLSRWHLPLGTIVHPLAEAPQGEEVPVVNFGASNIVRCRRCRAYINPYVVFLDGGRRWRCNVCTLLNEVPVDYFCPVDETGRRRDADERPELCKGSVEYVAPTEYMVRAPMPPSYFFLIDVSSASVRSGMLQVAVDTIRSSLDSLPGFPRTQIGFLTFDSTLHFHMLKGTLTQPQMMVVADLEDPFLPVPDDLLVNLSESRKVVEALLDSLPAMFQSTLNIESALGPALRATYTLMSPLGGKVLIFQSTLPSLGNGRLKLRGEDVRIYGTDREHTLRVTEDQFYKTMAGDCSKFQIGVNLYAFAERYTDLASLGTLAKYTGGNVYFYPGFQAHLHGEKFKYDLSRDLTRETAWEAVMRIRCGKGLRFSSFHGHFMLRSTDLLALPAVDCDKAFGLQISLDDTLLTTQTVYFQVALLYTSSSGERRIRVHTMATPVVGDLSEMYRTADCGAAVALLSRLAVEKSMVAKLEDARHVTQLRLVRSLREYRNMFAASHRIAGRLIYPESLRLLPLYTLAICKSLALRGGALDAQPDERSACAYEIMTLPVPRLLKLLYPSLYRVDDYLTQVLNSGEAVPKDLPPSLPLSAERLDPRGAYVLDDGLRCVLWFGKMFSQEVVASILGPEAVNLSDISKVPVREHNNIVSKRLHSLLKTLREHEPASYQQCVAIRQGDQPREGNLVLSTMVEDRSYGFLGYADWMVQTFKQIMQKGP